MVKKHYSITRVQTSLEPPFGPDDVLWLLGQLTFTDLTELAEWFVSNGIPRSPEYVARVLRDTIRQIEGEENE